MRETWLPGLLPVLRGHVRRFGDLVLVGDVFRLGGHVRLWEEAQDEEGLSSEDFFRRREPTPLKASRP